MAPALEPRTVQEWGAVAPQWVGIAGLVGSAIFWATTGRLSGVLVGAFLGLIGVGQGAEAAARARRVPAQAAIDQEREHRERTA